MVIADNNCFDPLEVISILRSCHHISFIILTHLLAEKVKFLQVVKNSVAET